MEINTKEYYTIEGCPNYCIAKNGQIINNKTGKILKFTPSVTGKDKTYLMIELTNDKGHRQKFYLHRLLALAFLTNPDNLTQVDHKNSNSLDNNLDNLRWVSHSINMRNRTKKKNGTSEFMGVSFVKKGIASKCWTSSISLDGKTKNLGFYSSEIEAAIAYDKATLECGYTHNNRLVKK